MIGTEGEPSTNSGFRLLIYKRGHTHSLSASDKPKNFDLKGFNNLTSWAPDFSNSHFSHFLSQSYLLCLGIIRMVLTDWKLEVHILWVRKNFNYSKPSRQLLPDLIEAFEVQMAPCRQCPFILPTASLILTNWLHHHSPSLGVSLFVPLSFLGPLGSRFPQGFSPQECAGIRA